MLIIDGIYIYTKTMITCDEHLAGQIYVGREELKVRSVGHCAIIEEDAMRIGTEADESAHVLDISRKKVQLRGLLDTGAVLTGIPSETWKRMGFDKDDLIDSRIRLSAENKGALRDISGKKVQLRGLLDTGAVLTIIPIETWKRMGFDKDDLIDSRIQLPAANKGALRVLGRTAIIALNLGERNLRMSFLVVENLDESDQFISGRDFIRNFDVKENKAPVFLSRRASHLQAFLRFAVAVDFSRAKRLFGIEQPHIERCRNVRQSEEYCRKAETRVEGPVTSIDPAAFQGGQGTRSDLAAVAAETNAGASVACIAEKYPATYIRFFPRWVSVPYWARVVFALSFSV